LPGTVTVSAKFGEVTYEGSAIAVAGNEVTIDLVSTPAATTPPETVRDPGAMTPPLTTSYPPPEYRHKSFWTPTHIAGVTAAGLAVVGAGIGIGFTAAHQSRVSDANKIAADPSACNPSTSSACKSYHDLTNRANNAKTGEIVSFVAAGALAATAVVLLLPIYGKEGSRRAHLVPTSNGFLLDGTF
jgi:hypothetical protein